MNDNSSENYLDNLLESLFESKDSSKNETDEMPQKETKKKVPLDQDDEFLKAFEDELESDAYKDYFANFEKELEMESHKEVEEISDDLQSILQGISANSNEMESIPPVPVATDVHENSVGESASLTEESFVEMEQKLGAQPISEAEETPVKDQEIEEVSLESLMAEDNNWNDDEKKIEQALQMTDAGEPDLAGNSDDDLLGLLAKTGDISDFGEILSEDGEIKQIDDGDIIGKFAENEMLENEKKASLDKAKATDKKPSFMDKLKSALFGDDKEESYEPEAVTSKSDSAALASMFSDENDMILKELDSSEEKEKKKDKKDKKKKASKPKADKKKKPVKLKKPQKPKKPKVVDNTPPLPKGPVVMIVLMVASLMVFVMLGTSFLGYSSNLSSAKKYYNNGKYEEAYRALEGMEIKEKDEKFYYQAMILAMVANEYHSYESFLEFDEQQMALDSLICAAGRCELNQKNATAYECTVEMSGLKEDIVASLETRYGMTYTEAVEMYNVGSRREYTIMLHQKIQELGLE